MIKMWEIEQPIVEIKLIGQLVQFSEECGWITRKISEEI